MIRFFLFFFFLFSAVGAGWAAPFSTSADSFTTGPRYNIKPKGVQTRGGYIALGANKVFSKDLSVADSDIDGGNAGTLRLQHGESLFVHVALGNAINSKVFRFRGELELVAGRDNIQLVRTTGTGNPVRLARGHLESYGANINLFYDLPTLFNFITPYIGGSGMALAQRFKIRGQKVGADGFNSKTLSDLAKKEKINQKGFNLVYGWGGTAGIRWELANWFAVDTGYRFIRFEGCLDKSACGLFEQKNAHEVRTNIVLRF